MDRLVSQVKTERRTPKCLSAVLTRWLSDAYIRESVKQYSQWPTIPQLYVDGEFVGGSDIMIELFQSGELATLIQDKEPSEQ